ncbi:MAG: GMP/IMP nucleotidase [Steroidobacteraceae bacterium]
MTKSHKQCSAADWSRIQTVLLDMDGTLLDLSFDNYFWTELIPLRYGAARGMALHEAQAELQPRFAAHQGTLQWYCTDHWSQQLGLNVAALKHEAREQIRFLPGAEAFLVAIRQMGRRVVLVTNAHLDACAVKFQHTGLEQYLDEVVSSHSLGFPKENPAFWPQLQNKLNLERTKALFVDDNLSVLRAAHAYGIGQVFAVAQPDSSMPVRHMAEFPAVNAVRELLPDPVRI